jgi:hypothetical protein
VCHRSKPSDEPHGVTTTHTLTLHCCVIYNTRQYAALMLGGLPDARSICRSPLPKAVGPVHAGQSHARSPHVRSRPHTLNYMTRPPFLFHLFLADSFSRGQTKQFVRACAYLNLAWTVDAKVGGVLISAGAAIVALPRIALGAASDATVLLHVAARGVSAQSSLQRTIISRTCLTITSAPVWKHSVSRKAEGNSPGQKRRETLVPG